MGYIQSGKEAGAKVEIGGERLGTEGYFIKPTIFTNTSPDMKIVQEEIFGPVGVVIKFKDEDDVIRQANDTLYGLAAAVFTQNLNRAIKMAHRLKAGTAWVNCMNQLNSQVPFGGFKQSGIGRELGEYALHKFVFFSYPWYWLVETLCLAIPLSRPCTLTSTSSCKIWRNAGEIWRGQTLPSMCIISWPPTARDISITSSMLVLLMHLYK